MTFGLLFWGFQDLNFVSEVAKKARHSLNIKDFYIQINDLEKTISLMDLYPEEIIRTKYDLNNLYQWLSRSTKKNILVVVELLNFVFQDNMEENYLSLKKILDLDFKICFVAPKILHPQSLKFVENLELNSIYQNTLEYTKTVKSLYEILINSGSKAQIISTPISEMVTINRENYFLFESRTKYKLAFFPKILKKFNASYISQNTLAIKLVEALSCALVPIGDSNKLLLANIEADCSTQYLNSSNNIFSKFKPAIPVSLERFFKVKSSTRELKFILWLMYMSICEYEVKASFIQNPEQSLAGLFFSNNT